MLEKIKATNFNVFSRLLIYIGFFIQAIYFTNNDVNQKYVLIGYIFFFILMYNVFMQHAFVVIFSFIFFYYLNDIHPLLVGKLISLAFFTPYFLFPIFKGIANFRNDIISRRKIDRAKSEKLKLEMNKYLKSKKETKNWDEFNCTEKEILVKEYLTKKQAKLKRSNRKWEKEQENNRMLKEIEEKKKKEFLEQQEKKRKEKI